MTSKPAAGPEYERAVHAWRERMAYRHSSAWRAMVSKPADTPAAQSGTAHRWRQTLADVAGTFGPMLLGFVGFPLALWALFTYLPWPFAIAFTIAGLCGIFHQSRAFLSKTEESHNDPE